MARPGNLWLQTAHGSTTPTARVPSVRGDKEDEANREASFSRRRPAVLAHRHHNNGSEEPNYQHQNWTRPNIHSTARYWNTKEKEPDWCWSHTRQAATHVAPGTGFRQARQRKHHNELYCRFMMTASEPTTESALNGPTGQMSGATSTPWRPPNSAPSRMRSLSILCLLYHGCGMGNNHVVASEPVCWQRPCARPVV